MNNKIKTGIGLYKQLSSEVQKKLHDSFMERLNNPNRFEEDINAIRKGAALIMNALIELRQEANIKEANSIIRMINWNEYYINLCNEVKTRSKDKNTQIGVVIVGEDNQIISTGYNSFPRGIDDNLEERQERPEKYYWFAHAETNAIINCALTGVSTKGARMYMSCSCPCTDCARNIINAGIKEIWCKNGNTTSNKEKWDEHAKRSIIMFKEAGVKINWYE